MMHMLDKRNSTENQPGQVQHNRQSGVEHSNLQPSVSTVSNNKIESMDDFGIASSSINEEGDKLPF